MSRNYQLPTRLSKEEYEKIKKKAESSGMTMSAFVRFVLLELKQIPTLGKSRQ